jgi:hypothetical protein
LSPIATNSKVPACDFGTPAARDQRRADVSRAIAPASTVESSPWQTDASGERASRPRSAGTGARTTTLELGSEPFKSVAAVRNATTLRRIRPARLALGREMRLGGLLVAALCVLALAPAGAFGRSFALADYLSARDGGFEASVLVPASSVTGARVAGRVVRLGDAVQGHVLSPDRHAVAFGGLNFGQVARVDLVHMRRLAPLALGRGSSMCSRGHHAAG